jgi:hypothetical protein
MAAPADSSKAATEATTEAAEGVDGGDDSEDRGPDRHLADDFKGIQWDRLAGYCKPFRTQQNKKSWV